jgi:hypothetical protein
LTNITGKEFPHSAPPRIGTAAVYTPCRPAVSVPSHPYRNSNLTHPFPAIPSSTTHHIILALILNDSSATLENQTRYTPARSRRNMSSPPPLRIGYVPEHFSTPLYFAHKHFGLDAVLIPFPSGTGHMITAIRGGEIDAAIGLTEGWIAGLGRSDLDQNDDGGYRLVGTYVDTPLCKSRPLSLTRPLLSLTNNTPQAGPSPPAQTAQTSPP